MRLGFFYDIQTTFYKITFYIAENLEGYSTFQMHIPQFLRTIQVVIETDFST